MKYLLANFKTNKNSREINSYFSELTSYYQRNEKLVSSKTIFFLNNLYVLNAKNNYPSINFGCQSGCHLGLGSFTSSVSLEQIAAEEIKNVLLGHSEEYEYFHQTIPTINKKVLKSLSLNLKIFLCFGNLKEIEDFNELIEELSLQINELLSSVEIGHFKNIVLAYEPVYVIGTGKSIDHNYASQIIKTLKEKLFLNYAHNFEIVYGGSVNTNNLKDFIESKDIDGVLIGKESLDIEKMEEMISINGREN